MIRSKTADFGIQFVNDDCLVRDTSEDDTYLTINKCTCDVFDGCQSQLASISRHCHWFSNQTDLHVESEGLRGPRRVNHFAVIVSTTGYGDKTLWRSSNLCRHQLGSKSSSSFNTSALRRECHVTTCCPILRVLFQHQ